MHNMRPFLAADIAVIPSLIKFRVETTPNATFAVFPSNTPDPINVTFSDFAVACQRSARILSPGTPNKAGYVVGIIANCDSLQYITTIGGLTLAGLTVYPISPRLPPASICHLLKSVSAQRLLTSSTTSPTLVDGIRDALSAEACLIQIEEMPPFTDVYGAASTTHQDLGDGHPFSIPEAAIFQHGVEVYLHSSGSTGLPKSIPYSHKFLQKLQHQDVFAAYPDEGTLYSGMLPSFHAMGFLFQLMHPLMTGKPVALFEPQYPEPPVLPTPATVIDGIRRSKASAAFVVPAFLEAWSHDTESMNILKGLKTIAYAGGPLAQEVGDKLVQAHCRIMAIYGSTEAACATGYHTQSRDVNDWAWMEFASNVSPRWVSHGDGLEELQLLTSDTHQLAVENLPDECGFAAQDLWIRHPSKTDLWRPVGRVDDVIVMNNGENVVPGPLEGALTAHPSVRGALAFGHGRDQIGLLIEVADCNDMGVDALSDAIWPTVEAGNCVMPAFARVFKDMLLFTSVNKAFPRAAKGTIIRKAALALYETEINTAYALAALSLRRKQDLSPDDWKDSTRVASWLHDTICSLIGQGVIDDQDVFLQGCDSLIAMLLRRRIISAMSLGEGSNARAASKLVNQDFVYAHRTIGSMARALTIFATTDRCNEDQVSRAAIEAIVEEYTRDMPALHTPRTPLPKRITVLLTGSTGSLGSHILDCLLHDERVVGVYVLNRPSKADRTSLLRHRVAILDRGLDEQQLQSSKLTFLEGVSSELNLGLSDQDYAMLSDTIDVVVHNAWQLDFNRDVKSFEQHIVGTRRIVDLAMTARNAGHIRVLFMSSVSVARNWPADGGLFPEDPQPSPEYAIGTGYGESKFVAEKILTTAYEHGLQTTSLRVGQISGASRTGAWALTDWVPILIKSSVELGCLPNSTGVVSWISPEAVAKVTLDGTFAEALPEVLHVSHYHPVPWTQVVTDVADALAEHGITKTRLAVISLDRWLQRLDETMEASSVQDLEKIPAAKLFSFFSEAARKEKEALDNVASHEAFAGTRLDVRNTCTLSPFLCEQPLVSQDVSRWIGFWKAHGLFRE